jgi:catechol 2,3-dioxygenase-like lactoylglutathione lyase family enzyme
MIDHISLRVQDLSRAVDFYKAALEPLGYQVLMEFPGVAGLGAGGKPDLWIMETDQAINPTHIALNGERSHIHAFHIAGLAAGGSDNGPPGLRVDLHPDYYAAFVLDPEGNNVEVVCHYPDSIVESAGRASKKRSTKPSNKKKSVKAAAKKVAVKTAAKKSAKPPAKKVVAKKSVKSAKPAAKAKKPPARAAGKKRR